MAVELRSLLGEELQARADVVGRPADEAMALALLASFGRPQDVAERYGPAGFVIIRPAAAPAFAWTALIGVAVQWAFSLPTFLSRAPTAAVGDLATAFARWWLSWGVGAFWFPGFIVVFAILAALVGECWPGARADWTPRRVLDPDRINRPLLALGLAAWAAYMILLAFEPLLLTRLPGPLAAVFTFDDDFIRSRGPWLFPVWGAQFLICTAVLVEGRWRRRTRELNALANAALCGLLAWFVVAGPIFTAKAADQMTKALVCIIVLLTLISLGITLYRGLGQTALPRGVATLPLH